MADDFQFDLFLSHSAKDKAVVRAIAEKLKQDGLRVWFDEWILKPGDSIPAKIEEGLEQSRVLVLCMSAHAFGSDWARLEAGTFRFRDPLNHDRRFIPLRLDDAPIKGSLAQFHYIDWHPQDHEQAYVNLLEACRPNGKPLPPLPEPAPPGAARSITAIVFEQMAFVGKLRQRSHHDADVGHCSFLEAQMILDSSPEDDDWGQIAAQQAAALVAVALANRLELSDSAIIYVANVCRCVLNLRGLRGDWDTEDAAALFELASTARNRHDDDVRIWIKEHAIR